MRFVNCNFVHVTSSKLGWLPVVGIVEALTSRCWPVDGVEEFWGGIKSEELLPVNKDLGPALEPMADLGSLIELPKEGSGGAGSGGVDGAGGYVASPSIPVHMLV